MEHFYNFLPILFGTTRVPLETGASENREAGDRGGSQSAGVLLRSEAVEDKVGQEDEEPLGRG